MRPLWSRGRLFLLSAVLLLLLAGYGAPSASAVTPGPTVSPSPEPAPVTVTMVAGGDVIPHAELMAGASVGKEAWDFVPIFDPVAEIIAEADYAFCTLETPVCWPYDFYPQFSSPEDLPRDLRDVGFDMFCLASNHCCDRRYRGIVSTLDTLDRLGVDHTGIYRTREERDQDRGLLFTEVNGIRFAFLNYTDSTNQYRMPGQEYVVKTFYADFWNKVPRELLYEDIEQDILYARESGADILIAVCHWGKEFSLEPMEYQRELADFMLQRGVDIIIGSHPHVPECAESRVIVGEDGTERTGYVFYSLGNFISAMANPAGEITPLVEMRFQRDPLTEDVTIEDVSYRPLYRVWDKGSAQPFRLVDMDDVSGAWSAGTAPGWMSGWHFDAISQAREQLLSIVGEELYAGKN